MLTFLVSSVQEVIIQKVIMQELMMMLQDRMMVQEVMMQDGMMMVEEVMMVQKMMMMQGVMMQQVMMRKWWWCRSWWCRRNYRSVTWDHQPAQQGAHECTEWSQVFNETKVRTMSRGTKESGMQVSEGGHSLDLTVLLQWVKDSESWGFTNPDSTWRLHGSCCFFGNRSR